MSGRLTAEIDTVCVEASAVAVIARLPAEVGFSDVDTTPKASVRNWQVEAPHALRMAPAPVAETVTASPALGVTPSPARTRTVKAEGATKPTGNIPVGALRICIVSGPAENAEVNDTPVPVADSTIAPAEVGVTALEATPLASVAIAQLADRQELNCTAPAVVEKTRLSPTDGVPSPSSTLTAKGVGGAVPTVAIPPGALRI